MTSSECMPLPRLIAIEGPAGAGKSTLTSALVDRLRILGRTAAAVDEFSSSPVGGLLKRVSCFGGDRHRAFKGIQGALVYFADKYYQFQHTRHEEVVVADRSFLTQGILGTQSAPDEASRDLVHALVRLLEDSVSGLFSGDSMVVFLHAPVGTLKGRVERRAQRALSCRQSELLRLEAEAYLRCALRGGSRFSRISLDARNSVDELVQAVTCAGGYL